MTAEPPDRALGGGNIRQAHLLLELARHCSVDLVSVGGVSDAAVKDAANHVVDLPSPLRRKQLQVRGQRLLDAYQGLLPALDREVLQGEAARTLLRPYAERASQYDLVYVEHLALAPLLGQGRRPPWAITLQNVASARYRQTAAVAGTAHHRVVWEMQARKARRLERWTATNFDRVFVPSAEDARLLGRDVVVVPNGVDLERYPGTPMERAPTMVFTGSLNYPPNVDGIVWFCDEVFPHIIRRVPQATLDIVGRAPAPQVSALATRDGVRLYPDVAETYPFLARARIAVVPLRVGTGTRLKALEAMAVGRVVAGTSIGLEGLGITHDVHAAVADEAIGLAEAIIGLLLEEARAERMAAAGQFLVRTRFDWQSIGADFAGHVLRLVVRRSE